jgi:hypothetical protein
MFPRVFFGIFGMFLRVLNMNFSFSNLNLVLAKNYKILETQLYIYIYIFLPLIEPDPDLVSFSRDRQTVSPRKRRAARVYPVYPLAQAQSPRFASLCRITSTLRGLNRLAIPLLQIYIYISAHAFFSVPHHQPPAWPHAIFLPALVRLVRLRK